MIPPRFHASAIVLAGAALTGCGSGGDEAERLSLYCQTTQCHCIEDTVIPFGAAAKREPAWSLSGEPSCPDGFRLEPVEN
ncbi:hypothetical protein [Rhodospira trueperi]|uniref:Lipoprotein n=1 Tax=Rhodospira trueperi TaxID=69960 RepID=A0A1G7CQ59_9PROT|nr:hypothetical protein [Rhodospira trueperi]SDE41439.1 hypothetical protein SAMN05421720_106173 [Rhodospira trueperi]